MTEPVLLFHYTDGGALISILEKKLLRASEAVYLNDSREIVAGAGLVKEYLRAKIASLEPQLKAATGEFEPGGSADLKSRLAVARSGVESISQLEEAPDRMATRPFVCCFSEAKDSLSQWRAYGNYAIGFDPTALARAKAVGRKPTPPTDTNDYARDRSEVTLTKVLYEPSELFDIFKPKADDTLAPGNALGRGFPYLRLGRHIVESLIQYKDAGFHEELEWRLSYLRGPELVEDYEPDVLYRSGLFTIVPYINLEIEKEAIREIWVGPSSHQGLQISAVRRVLKTYDIHADVRASSVPYRTVREYAG